jgi:hypothetical protein
MNALSSAIVEVTVVLVIALPGGFVLALQYAGGEVTGTVTIPSVASH